MADIKYTVQVDSSQAKRNLETLSKTTDNVRASFNRLALAAAGIAAVGAASGGILRTGAAFEDLRSSLNAVFGGAQQGAQAFDQIQQFAKTTQFSVQQLTKNFVQLKAAGVEPTTELLRVFADTASVTTDELGTFQAAIDLIARTTAGGLGLEELNRLADRGVPVFDILNEKLGVTRLEISDLGKTSEGAAKIIAALTEGLEERFGGASISRAQNLNQIINNLGDSFDELQDSLFQAGFGDFFKVLAAGFSAALTSITGFIDRNEQGFRTMFQNIGQGLVTFVSSFLIGTASILDTISPIFGVLRSGFNNVVGFINALPMELKAFGVIGFLAMGGKAKLITLALFTLFDGIIWLLNKTVQGVEWLTNKAIDGFNILIEQYNRLPGLPDIDLMGKVQFPEFNADDVKAGLRDLADLVFDTPLIGKMGPIEENVRGFVTTYQSAIDEMLAKLAELRNKSKDPIMPPTTGADGTESANRFTQGWDNALTKFRENVENQAQYAENIFNTMAQGFTDAITNFVMTGKLSFKDLFRSLLTELVKLQANRLFLTLFGGGGPFAAIGNLFAGGFSRGGMIPAGQIGLVGERGPEFIGGPAQITPIRQSDSMMGGTQVVNYNISAVDARSFRELVARDPEFIHAVASTGARRLPR